MTLRELFELVGERRYEYRVPGKEQLLSRGEKVIQEYEQTTKDSQPMKITVFESGYVLYYEGKRYSIFHLQELLENDFGYEWDELADTGLIRKNIINELLMDAEWIVGISLYGNSRIFINLINDKKDRNCSIYELSENDPVLGVYASPTAEIEEQIRHEKEERIYEYLRKRMNPTQWKVYVLVEQENLYQKEIGKKLGITQQAVSKDYKKACKRVLEVREIIKKYYYED